MSQSEGIYGVLAEFETGEGLIHAIHRAREEGYRALDAFSPYPLEELDEALHLPPTRLPWIVFAAGCFGGLFAFGMQWFATAVHYPLNVAGKPYNSWPAYIPITFELTVLFAALTGLVAMIALNGLPRHYHPLLNVPQFERASHDRFYLCIESGDAKFDPRKTRDFLAGLQPLSVVEVPS